MRPIYRLFLLSLMLYAGICYAQCYDIPKSQMIGENHYVQVKKGDSFVSIAKKFGVGYEQLSAAIRVLMGLSLLKMQWCLFHHKLLFRQSVTTAS